MTARILVADGVATTRITLKVRLSAACYDVATASRIAQIPELIDQTQPDLIILGSGFGEDVAIELCARLAEDRQTRGIPILMLVRSASRLAALQAGASAALDPEINDQMLLARVRGMLRDCDAPVGLDLGMAEAGPSFDETALPHIVLVTDNPARSQRWRQLLSDRIEARFDIRNPEEALSGVRLGRSADLYLICADLETRGDGLRLLSELRSRQGSRDAGFVIAIGRDRDEMAAIALDLGAGDVLPDSLGGPEEIDAAAMTLRMQLSRKSRSDRHRAEVRRHMIWAMTDPLTGLYNRRYALPKLSDIARDAMLNGQDFSVLAMDLDHFKAINDRFGHGAGDAVLSTVAQRITRVLGNRGLAARLGGEEFMAVICPCDAQQAQVMAERMRLAIQDTPVGLPALSGGGQVRITVSVGVVTVCAPDGEVWPDHLARDTLERADRALLAAKARGRNRVVISHREHAA